MRLVNLDEKNNDRYKVVLSRKDWKKLLLGIHDYMVVIVFFIVFFGLIILYVFYKILYSKFYHVFASLKWTIFYVSILLFTGLILWSYYKLFTNFLKPFNLRGAVIDVVDRKIYLKNKTFSFKEKDSMVFYLERKREKSKAFPKNNKKMKEGKDKSASDWVYYVKKKAFPQPRNQKLSNQAFLNNSFEEFIIPPVEIKYLEDFSLVLGKEGLLGTWRQIAKLLGVGFEENIEWEEQILLQSTENAFSSKKSNDSPIDQESRSQNEDAGNEKKIRDVLNLLKEKMKKKDTLGGTSSCSDDFEEFVLFKDELMGVRMFSTGFELRFWSGTSEFPGKEPVVNTRFVFDKLIHYIGWAMFIILIFAVIFRVQPIEDMALKIFLYSDALLLFIYFVASDLENSIENTRSKESLFRITYVLKNSSILTFIISFIILGLSENSLDFIISFFYFLPFISGVLLFFSVLGDLYSSSCPWNLTINRYMSRLVFSFEYQVFEGKYGFCVSRTHWRAPVSKIRFLALLKIGRSLFGSGDFLLAIKIDEDYVLLPLPDLGEDKIHELFFFLQHVFNTLLASYSLKNTGTTK